MAWQVSEGRRYQRLGFAPTRRGTPRGDVVVSILNRKAIALTLLVAASVTSLSALAAGPDPGVPPRPFLPDYFFGTVLVQGSVPPAGTQLMACIDDCDSVFAGAPVRLGELGKFSGLTVGPKDETLINHPIRFYLVNEHGRMPAAETVSFAGALELKRLNLTFHRPLSSLGGPPAPPAVGDWVVPVLPKVALALGAALAVAGGTLLLVARRRELWWGRPRPSAPLPTVRPET
jgi:hypothetical protein